MKSVSICHALRDRERARELAGFIHTNLGFEVSLDDAQITGETDILAATERALSANFAIVLLSPASLPAPLPRAEWERAFVKAPAEYETPIAFVMLDECPFPDILRRSRFLDGKEDFVACMRGLKRWMLAAERGEAPGPASAAPALPEALAEIWREVVDTPGSSTHLEPELAMALEREAHQDFERVLRVDCSGRPLEIVLGEIGRALRLPLTGPVEENRRAVEWHAMSRRYLLILDAADDEIASALRFDGRCSVVSTPPREHVAKPVSVSAVSITNIAHAATYALATIPHADDSSARLAKRVSNVLSDNAHYAEAALVLEAVLKHIPALANWARRELDWIQDRWGQSVEIPPAPIVNAMQLDLFGDHTGDQTCIAA